MRDQDIDQSIDDGIVAYKEGQSQRAFELITQALHADPTREKGWLWLSALVQSDAERRYCLERVIEINPSHIPAQHGIQSLPSDLVARSPLPVSPSKSPNPFCTYPGCTEHVSRPEHTLCRTHRKQINIRSGSARASHQPPQEHTNHDFRKRLLPEYRTTDGHFVRSKAEMLIDNWLYTAGIVHAYERKLPIKEDAYCDFYLPSGKVYLECWGIENDDAYNNRRKLKTELYQRYQLALIDLTDDHVRNLDDHLPKLLLTYNIMVE